MFDKVLNTTEAVTGGVLYKKGVLRNIANSQENTCASLYFNKVAALKRDSRILRNFSEHFFIEHLRTTVSNMALQKQSSEGVLQKDVLKNFAKFTRKVLY